MGWRDSCWGEEVVSWPTWLSLFVGPNGLLVLAALRTRLQSGEDRTRRSMSAVPSPPGCI